MHNPKHGRGAFVGLAQWRGKRNGVAILTRNPRMSAGRRYPPSGEKVISCEPWSNPLPTKKTRPKSSTPPGIAVKTRLMPLVRHCRFTAIDFESAGAARGRTDRPVQVGLASWSAENGHFDSFVSYLHTDQPIQWAARKIHGIGPQHLADAPSLLSLWPEVKKRLAGAVVVAHGKGTEKRFLRAFPGHGFGPWVDTLLLARAAWPDLPDHSLGSLCGSHGLTAEIQALVPGKFWHDALFDAVASLALLAFLINNHPLTDQPVATLYQPDTSRWHQSKRL